MVCMSMRNVCSMSKRRRNACQIRSTSLLLAFGWDHQSQTGLAVPPEGSRSTVSRTTVPSMIGSVPVWLVQAVRWVNRGCNACQARTVAVNDGRKLTPCWFGSIGGRACRLAVLAGRGLGCGCGSCRP